MLTRRTAAIFAAMLQTLKAFSKPSSWDICILLLVVDMTNVVKGYDMSMAAGQVGMAMFGLDCYSRSSSSKENLGLFCILAIGPG
jgi:hypothetical protein